MRITSSLRLPKHVLGENWLPEYVQRANAGGIERVLVLTLKGCLHAAGETLKRPSLGLARRRGGGRLRGRQFSHAAEVGVPPPGTGARPERLALLTARP